MRRPGLVAACLRRVEGQLRQELLARGIAGGDLLELDEIGAARCRVLVNALQMRLVPKPHELHVRGPCATPRAQAAIEIDERWPVSLGTRRSAKGGKRHRRIKAG